MKKIISTMLAGAMVMSMAATSMAAAQTPGWVRTTATLVETDHKDDNGKVIPGVYDAHGPYAYDIDDDKALTQDAIEYGDTAYYVLTDVTGSGITDSDSVDGLKVKAKWEEGEKLSKGVSITKKKISDVRINTKALIPEMNKYYYMLAVSTAKSTSTSDADLIGTLTLNKSKSPKVKDLELDIALNINWSNSYLDGTNDFIVDSDIDGLEAEKFYSLKFNADDEIEISFEDDSTFTVDVSGQNKTLVYFDTTFNANVASRYPLADLNFWNGNGAKFNRTGEFFLSTASDETSYLYELKADGTLAKVSGAEFDDSDEGFYFKTRTLGTYITSDTGLDLDSPSDDGDDDVVVTPIAPVVPANPNTGARA